MTTRRCLWSWSGRTCSSSSASATALSCHAPLKTAPRRPTCSPRQSRPAATRSPTSSAASWRSRASSTPPCATAQSACLAAPHAHRLAPFRAARLSPARPDPRLGCLGLTPCARDDVPLRSHTLRSRTLSLALTWRLGRRSPGRPARISFAHTASAGALRGTPELWPDADVCPYVLGCRAALEPLGVRTAFAPMPRQLLDTVVRQQIEAAFNPPEADWGTRLLPGTPLHSRCVDRSSLAHMPADPRRAG